MLASINDTDSMKGLQLGGSFLKYLNHAYDKKPQSHPFQPWYTIVNQQREMLSAVMGFAGLLTAPLLICVRKFQMQLTHLP